MNIPGDHRKIRIFFHQNTFIPSLIKMPHALVSLVEKTCIDYVEPAHEFGKIAEGCFYEKMEMVGHKDIGIDLYGIYFSRL